MDRLQCNILQTSELLRRYHAIYCKVVNYAGAIMQYSKSNELGRR